VAAATEGYLFGIPAIAFSQVERDWVEIDAAAKVARDIVMRQFDQLQRPYLLNVNIPNLPYDRLGPPVATRLGKRHASEPVHKLTDPFGKDMYWIGAVGKILDASEGTDFHAIAQGLVSITPLQIDLTHAKQMQALREALA
jgi:5'-nucleotidase